MKKILVILIFFAFATVFASPANASVSDGNWWNGCHSAVSNAVNFLSGKLGIPLAYAQTCNWTAAPACSISGIFGTWNLTYDSAPSGGERNFQTGLPMSLVFNADQTGTLLGASLNSVSVTKNSVAFITYGTGSFQQYYGALQSNGALSGTFSDSQNNIGAFSYNWHADKVATSSALIAKTTFSWPVYTDACGSSVYYDLETIPGGVVGRGGANPEVFYGLPSASFTVGQNLNATYGWNVLGYVSVPGRTCQQGTIQPAPPSPSNYVTPASCSAVTVDIKANGSDGPITITSGTAATLSWTSANADSCAASGGWSGAKATGGSESTGNLNSSKTYTITCINDYSSASDSVVVNVSAPGDFTLGQGALQCNSAGLTWTASSGADGYRVLKGSPRVTIATTTALAYTDYDVTQNQTYNYQVEAFNGAGTNRSNNINITTPYCPPTISFSANPTNVFQGQSSTLTWSTSFATSCSASASPGQSDWNGGKAVNGSQSVAPSPPPSVVYNLNCSGPGGSVSASSTVNIAPLALPNWREIIPR